MIYYCCANNQNIGDYFSMLGLAQLIGRPGETVLMAGDEKRFDQAVGAIGGDDVLLIGGGGLLKSHFTKYWKVIFKHQDLRRFRMASFGIGVCDIKGKATVMPDDFLLEIARRSLKLFVRPTIPPALAADAVEVFCPSNFYFSRRPRVSTTDGKGYLLYVEHPKLVGDDKNDQIKAALQAYCEARAITLRVYDNTVVGDDYEAATAIYGGAEVVVSTRLHGVILATALDKRVLAISNDFKIEGYLGKLGSHDLIGLEAFSPEALAAKLDQAPSPATSSAQINLDLQAKAAQLVALL